MGLVRYCSMRIIMTLTVLELKNQFIDSLAVRGEAIAVKSEIMDNGG